MLLDSMEAGKLHANLKVPKGTSKSGDFPSLLSSALDDFKYRDWYGFGKQLGTSMQDLLVVTFAQKYEIDAVGSLGHRPPVFKGTPNRLSLVAVAVGAVSAGFLATFAIVRSRRAIAAAQGETSRGLRFDRLHSVPVLADDDLEAIVE